MAELIVLAVSYGLWRRIKRRWDAREAGNAAACFVRIARGASFAVAVAAAVAATAISSFEHALAGILGAAYLVVVALIGASFLCAHLYLPGLLSTRVAAHVGYWLTVALATVAWIYDPHVLCYLAASRSDVVANGLMGLGGAFAAASLAPDWLATHFAEDESLALPVRPLFYSGTMATALIAGLARHAYTWQEALIFGPGMGAVGAFAVIAVFYITIDKSRSIAAWADDHGWLPAKMPPPDLTLPPDVPIVPASQRIEEMLTWLRALFNGSA
ncbi:MAG: hypothetical protein IPI49_19450 [Myxococcales bacterium]|nr:hypothetical protein [Myxococcales bacterium]